MIYRTHNCGELRIKDLGKKVILCGWVRRIRDMGSIVWIDLRDRYGITQLTIYKKIASTELLEKVNKLGREYVIQAEGKVIERESKNYKIPTGEIEIQVENISILSESEIPPFLIENETDANEDLRLKYRYLDLRRPIMQENLIIRHKIISTIREFLNEKGFIEVETPILIRSTPEGARDFVVPSRLYPGHFYALPQSPQIFKQLLMISGIDKYYQIARCFRDEDLRSDRQPEFTQLDCELSFCTISDILTLFENLIKHLFKKILNISLNNFTILNYNEALQKYGTDKPDLRFNLFMIDLTHKLKKIGFNLFDNSSISIAIPIKEINLSRKILDEFSELTKINGLNGFSYIRVSENDIKSSFDKYVNKEFLLDILKELNLTKGTILIISGNDTEKVYLIGNEIIKKVITICNIKPEVEYAPVWIIEFPMFEWDPENNRYKTVHHPFTSPLDEDIELIEKGELEKVRAKSYDLIINGVEIGGGSIRINNLDLQNKIFKILNLTEEEIEQNFGFLLNAFKYGVPPHGGIAFGIDRLCAIMVKANSIRDVIAFPKNQAAKDLMANSPAPITNQQLNELHITIKKN